MHESKMEKEEGRHSKSSTSGASIIFATVYFSYLISTLIRDNTTSYSWNKCLLYNFDNGCRKHVLELLFRIAQRECETISTIYHFKMKWTREQNVLGILLFFSLNNLKVQIQQQQNICYNQTKGRQKYHKNKIWIETIFLLVCSFCFTNMDS